MALVFLMMFLFLSFFLNEDCLLDSFKSLIASVEKKIKTVKSTDQ